MPPPLASGTGGRVSSSPYVVAMKEPAPRHLLDLADQWEDLKGSDRAKLGRALRRLGWIYGEIREVRPVAKGTLSGWCGSIRLSTAQIAAIKKRTKRGRLGLPLDTQWRRRLEIDRIETQARAGVPQLIDQTLWVAGVSLYWGEGAKTGRILALVNADSRLLNVFLAWARTYHTPNAEFVLSLNLHASNDELRARQHWVTVLDSTDRYLRRPMSSQIGPATARTTSNTVFVEFACDGARMPGSGRRFGSTSSRRGRPDKHPLLISLGGR